MFLKGKRALVTGSTSGIGLGIARALAAEGAETIITGFGDKDEIAKICAELGASHIDADLSTAEGAEALMAGAGHVDILVNNAGMQFVSPVEEFPVEKWDKIIALNLSAAFHTIRLAVPHMKAQGWGRIINTASAHSLTASPFKSAYVAAKHGLVGFSKVLALETADTDITINTICPAYVKTPLVEKQIAAQARTHGISEDAVVNEIMLKPMPTKAFIGIDEIAGIVAFLISPPARNITGQTIVVDGGASIA